MVTNAVGMPARSLRRSLRLGSIAIGAAASLVLLASSIASNAIRRSVDASHEQLRTEQRVADHIVDAAYSQQIAAFRYIQSPSRTARADFARRGAAAYAEIQKYLFLDMPRESRWRVELIKEQHQEFEVAAQRAFELVGTADASDMRARVQQLEELGMRLEASVREFIRDRERQAQAQRVRLEGQLHLLQVALLAGALLIGFAAIALAEVARRRVVVPLSELSDAVRRIGDGEAQVHVAPQRDLEFRQLGESVELMAERIRAARQEIEHRNNELTRALADLRRAQQELVQHEKLSAVGEMLAGLAHELNNPLAGVLGMAELLKNDLSHSDDPRLRELDRELAGPLVTEATRARDLVRNLLSFARASGSRLEPVPLDETVAVALGLCRHRFTMQRHEITVNIPAGLRVVAQTQKLEHAIVNVVTNALHALEAGGGSALAIHASCDGPWVTLHFDDDGTGFQEVERVFDPFYTTKAAGEGTGLGLSLVHRFITEFGGSVRAANRPLKGARVTFQLPLAEPEAVEASAPETVQAPAVATRKLRVLVAEDEPALRKVQERMLVGMGLEPTLVSSGREAVETLERQRFDLVITDLRMPGSVSGHELLGWLSRHRPGLARTALVVTGDVSSEIPRDLMLEGRVMTKPFKRDEYEGMVRQFLAPAEAAVPA